MMRVEVTMPARHLASVRDDLVARRGRVLDKAWSGDSLELVARVPLVNMLGYRHTLRAATEGQGHHSMCFDS